jgi:4-amino-4-deoxy-L-arabinose transferase-like glycosyltransferase
VHERWSQVNHTALVLTILLILAGVVFMTYPTAVSVDEEFNGDRRQYLELAHSLVESGSFSMRVRQSTSDPVIWRPPGFPAFLGACLLATGEINRPLNELVKGDLPRTKRLYFCLQLLVAAAIAWCAWGLFKSRWSAVACFALIALNPSLAIQCSKLLSEPFTAFLLTLLSLLLLAATKNACLKYGAAAGLCCGILCLSRATFLYFAPIATLWLWLVPPALLKKKKALRLPTVFFLCFGLVVAPWLMRNHSLSGRFLISDRGGFMLYVRGLHDTMNKKEFAASFLAWSGLKIARKTLKKRFRPKDYQRILKSKEDSFLGDAKERAFSLYKPREKYDPRRAAQADLTLTKDGMELILTHPIRHLLVSIPVALRSTYVVRGVLGPILFFSLCLLFLGSCYRRRWLWATVLLPTMFSFTILAALTTGSPRYSIPLIPQAVLALIAVAFLAYSRANRAVGLRQRGHTASNEKVD